MIPDADWIALIPHRGAMCLLDGVVTWDRERIHATTHSHRRRDHPLRGAHGLRALHACEYGAQAMAIHGGLCARADGRVAQAGLLVSLRAVELRRARIDDLPGALDVYAERLFGSAAGWQYAFSVEHLGTPIAAGRAAVMIDPRV